MLCFTERKNMQLGGADVTEEEGILLEEGGGVVILGNVILMDPQDSGKKIETKVQG